MEIIDNETKKSMKENNIIFEFEQNYFSIDLREISKLLLVHEKRLSELEKRLI